MGLDGVELVMECEDTFGIAIPDADAAACVTVGDLCDTVLRLLQEAGGPAPVEPFVWERIRAMASEQFGVPIERVTRNARFVEDLGMV